MFKHRVFRSPDSGNSSGGNNFIKRRELRDSDIMRTEAKFDQLLFEAREMVAQSPPGRLISIARSYMTKAHTIIDISGEKPVTTRGFVFDDYVGAHVAFELVCFEVTDRIDA
jgi:hypothetical protein